jgi:hypothetical protein
MKRIAIVSAIVAILGACAAPAAPVATTSTPIAEPSPVASLRASASPAQIIHPVAAPATTWGDWLADVESIPGLGDAGPRIQLSLDWQNGRSAWVQLTDGSLVLQSDSVAADPGEIRFVASDEAVACESGASGRYTWARSTDGMFLTLTPVEDECDLRATTLGRSWTHSLGAVNDGGRGVANTAGGTFEITLPDEQFAMGGSDGLTDIHSDEGHQLVAVGNPAGYRTPCSASAPRDPFGIEPTIDAFSDYVRGLPGTTVAAEERQIDGNRAVHLTISSDASADCPGGEIFIYRPDNADEDADIVIRPGDSLSIWAIDGPEGISVLLYQGDDVTPADEEHVISTVRFVDELPAK